MGGKPCGRLLLGGAFDIQPQLGESSNHLLLGEDRPQLPIPFGNDCHGRDRGREEAKPFVKLQAPACSSGLILAEAIERDALHCAHVIV